jgi:hypothetical protein
MQNDPRYRPVEKAAVSTRRRRTLKLLNKKAGQIRSTRVSNPESEWLSARHKMAMSKHFPACLSVSEAGIQPVLPDARVMDMKQKMLLRKHFLRAYKNIHRYDNQRSFPPGCFPSQLTTALIRSGAVAFQV